ncbi:MAG TPA: D-2-hydroxyacid dehydrogenase [bacterium]|nr:D-2-hydroxyacid dehydrogenase [bacterium]
MPPRPPVSVLIASYLEPECVERVRAVPGVEVMYEPELLPKPRYQGEHHGQPFTRGAQDETRWRALLARAEASFDFDYTNLERIPVLAPRLRWIQATSAGIGEMLVRTGLVDSSITFTTASGIHAGPLGEFCVTAMLVFVKDLGRLRIEQAAHRWERYCARELRGLTLGVIGLGNVGREVARMGDALGMRVIGTKRTIPADGVAHVELALPPERSGEVIREADVLVLTVPQTPGTRRLLGEQELRSMKRGAILINIARGAVVDEPALVAALRDGHLGGAALDVFAREPLPPDSPLWDLPNVIVSPHSASTVPAENARLTELFCDNLRRYIENRPLRNLFERERLY